MLLRNLVALAVGSDPLTYDLPLVRATHVLGLLVQATDLWVIGATAATAASIFALLYLTPLGRRLRAIADDPDLARSSGIRSGRALIFLWSMVGVVCAIAGILLGVKSVLQPGCFFGAGRASWAAARECAEMAGYAVAVLIQVCIYVLLTLSLNLQYGYTGLINFGLVAFYCIGAYASALMTIHGLGMPIAVVLSGMIGGAAAMPIGALTLRLRAEYLAIVTLGFAETVRLVAENEIWLTHGTDGLGGLPKPFAGIGSPLTGETLYLGVLLASIGAAVLVVRRMTNSPLGRLMRAIRDREVAVRALGKSPAQVKMTSLVMGGALAGVAGSLQALYVGYVSPDQFTGNVTFLCWMAMIIGGTGRIAGSVLGATLLLVFIEGSRFLRDALPWIGEVQMAHLRLATVGLGLILFIRYRPKGLLPEFS